jgi:hypothetical protein
MSEIFTLFNQVTKKYFKSLKYKRLIIGMKFALSNLRDLFSESTQTTLILGEEQCLHN